MEREYFLTYNGQEVEQSDLSLIAEDAALADDRVLAELFRLKPSQSPVSKGVLPYSLGPTVAPSGADGSVRIYPFRAFVASTTAASTDAKKNWRDIRSVVYIGNPTNEYKLQALSANTSGFNRWDLVYARIDKDVNETGVVRYVKTAGPPVVETPTTVSVVKATTAVVGIVVGTPSATPDIPTLPTDSGSTFYIPLVYILVPNGFGATSTVTSSFMYETAPVLNLSRVTGATTAGVANTQNKAGGPAISTAVIHAWGLGTRPEIYLPSTMVGEEVLYIALNLQDASSSNWSQLDGTIVDDSRDWRKRIFSWSAQVMTGTSARFSWSQTSTSNTSPTIPSIYGDVGAHKNIGFGQTFALDSTNSNVYPVCILDNSNFTAISGINQIMLYVDSNDSGKLKMTTGGTVPAVRAFIRLCASAPFSNV